MDSTESIHSASHCLRRGILDPLSVAMRFVLGLLLLVAIGIAVASARPADPVPAKPAGPGGIVQEVLNTPVGLVKSLSSSLTNIFGQVTHVVPEILATVS